MMGLTFTAHGQKKGKEQLQTKKVLLQDEIEIASKILSETQQTKKASVGQVQALNQKRRYGLSEVSKLVLKQFTLGVR